MNLYEQELQRALDLIIFRDYTRQYLSTSDDDVMRIFSGDVSTAKHALKVFHERHPKETWITSDNGGCQVKVSGLFRDPGQSIQKEKFRQQKRRKGK